MCSEFFLQFFLQFAWQNVFSKCVLQFAWQNVLKMCCTAEDSQGSPYSFGRNRTMSVQNQMISILLYPLTGLHSK